MVTLRLVFILVIIQSNLALSMKLLQDSSSKHVKEKHYLSHRLLKRQVQCNDGEYHGEKHCCQYCREGTYAESDCSVEHGEPACKECSEGVDFTDKKNGLQKCEKCRHCDSISGQEEQRRCTKTQNTVCRCKKGFFCPESLPSADVNCDRCKKCKICDSGIVEECTSTKDTICKSRHHIMAWCSVGVIFAIIIIYMIYVIFCKRPKGKEQIATPSVKKLRCPSHLKDIALENHLYDIAAIMAQDSVLKLVAKKLTPVEIEESKINHPNNNRDQKYELLRTWYNANGSQGAFKMLIETCVTREAEKILNLVQTGNAEP